MGLRGSTIARLLAGLEPARPTDEQKWRIAKGIADKSVKRGLWTEEEADEFMETVRRRGDGQGM